MDDDFDVNAAVDDIGSGLGIEIEEATTEDAELKAPAASEVPAPTTPEVTAPPATATPTPATPATPETPPKTWRKEASAVWASLPSEAKSEILKREEDIFKGIESYKADATMGKSIKSVIAPYEGIFRQLRIDPIAQVGSLLRTHHNLATGTPEVKRAILLDIAKQCGADLGQSEGEPPYIDPAVKLLQTELNTVKSQLSVAERTRQSELAAANKRQVDSFAADPKNVYFNEVAATMANLLNRGIVGTLQDAYDQAIWLTPTVRAKEVAKAHTTAATSATTAAKAQVAKAKAATAANVRTSAKSGSAATPLGSLDDTLAAAFANIKSRG